MRLLKLLRDAGWVEVVGDRRNAFWKRTKRRLRPVQNEGEEQIKVASEPVGPGAAETVVEPEEGDRVVEALEVPRRPPRPRVVLNEADVEAVTAFFRPHPGARSKDVRVALPHMSAADIFRIAERLCRGMGFYREGQWIFYDATLVR